MYPYWSNHDTDASLSDNKQQSPTTAVRTRPPPSSDYEVLASRNLVRCGELTFIFSGSFAVSWYVILDWSYKGFNPQHSALQIKMRIRRGSRQKHFTHDLPRLSTVFSILELQLTCSLWKYILLPYGKWCLPIAVESRTSWQCQPGKENGSAGRLLQFFVFLSHSFVSSTLFYFQQLACGALVTGT